MLLPLELYCSFFMAPKVVLLFTHTQLPTFFCRDADDGGGMFAQQDVTLKLVVHDSMLAGWVWDEMGWEFSQSELSTVGEGSTCRMEFF